MSVSSLQGLTGALSLSSPGNTIQIGTSGSATITLDINRQQGLDTLLSTTSATTIATFTPVANGLFKVWIYVRVTSPGCLLTVTVNYSNGGGAQTYTPLNSSLGPGDYAIVPVPVFASTAANVTVVATAAVANVINITASIEQG